MRVTVGRRMLSVMAVVLGLTVLAGAGPVGAASPAAISGWTVIPGSQRTLDRPAATQHGGKTWVFVRGTDDRLHYTRKTASGWAAWTLLGSRFAVKDAPAVVSFKNKLNVFVRRAKDNHVLRRTWNGTAWSKWSDITATNGETLSGPAATVHDGKILVVIRRPDDRLYENRFSGTAWSGWTEVWLDGLTDVAPTVASDGGSAILVVKGQGGSTTWENVFTSSWNGWFLTDAISPAPSALAVIGGLPFLFQRTELGAVQGFTRGAGWSAPFELPGIGTDSGPGATLAGSSIMVFVRNAKNKVAYSKVTPEGAQ